MALAHTILALLAKHPESGYDISKHFDEGLSCYWKATQQQVYRELGKMTKAHWVTFETIPQVGKPDKKIYRITELGWQELTRWYAEPTEPTPIREDLLVKVLIGYKMERQFLCQELHHRRKLHSEQLSLYREEEAIYLKEQAEHREHLDMNDIEMQFKYLTMKRGIANEVSWVTWCDEVIDFLEKC
ncbi:MAG: putative transcriptional regulator [Phormidesmis priestleyi Ana]|uniref:Putative transcriptional regulator n=1 Tax=Phormidesmis priestleyi Ana TaxID=1666911 RepID=A0A0P7YSI9_9CYAN|nr:MAG: putative transcriptional regulator [Phormidesmis priestleyi Ana]